MSPAITNQPTDAGIPSILESLRCAATGPGEFSFRSSVKQGKQFAFADAKAAADKLALAVSKAGVGTLESVALLHGQRSSLLMPSNLNVFSDQNIISTLHVFALNKKSGYERESAAIGFQSLPAVLGASSAPFLLSSLPVLFDLYSDKGEVVRTAASTATKSILQLFPPEATRIVFTSLADVLEKGKWQTKVGALDALKTFVSTAKEAVADELGHILPKVELAMHDTKKEVTCLVTAC